MVKRERKKDVFFKWDFLLISALLHVSSNKKQAFTGLVLRQNVTNTHKALIPLVGC